jgi:DNA-binding response OmpR family regulator
MMKLPYRILVLDDDEHALAGLVELLRDVGHSVTGAATYDAAKRLLSLGSYDLLIADVRLRGFNGIDLVRQSTREHPDMAAIIITGYDEPMMELEAGRYGARFVRKPIQATAFLSLVTESLTSVRRQRRWPRKRVVGGFRVTAAGRPAAVVDVCYGGLRLEMVADQQLPASFDVEVAGIGLHLEVEPVWAQKSDGGTTVLCGAALSSDATPAARTWRAIVDRLTA